LGKKNPPVSKKKSASSSEIRKMTARRPFHSELGTSCLSKIDTNEWLKRSIGDIKKEVSMVT
jgi:hypothetical protein